MGQNRMASAATMGGHSTLSPRPKGHSVLSLWSKDLGAFGSRPCARHGLLFSTGPEPVSDLTAHAVGDDCSEPPVADPHDRWCGRWGWPLRASPCEPTRPLPSAADTPKALRVYRQPT